MARLSSLACPVRGPRTDPSGDLFLCALSFRFSIGGSHYPAGRNYCKKSGVDPLESKLGAAKQCGASHTVNSSVDDAIQAVREITHGGADTAFEAAGSQDAIAQAFAATRRGGRTVAIGLPHPDRILSIPALTVIAEERTLMGSYMGSCVPSRDIPRFISMYRAGLLPVDLLRSSIIALEDVNAAFDILDRGEAVRQIIRF